MRKYKTLASELTILSEKVPHEFASFKEKIVAYGAHHAQPAAPFEARAILGMRVFEALLTAEPHFAEEVMPDTQYETDFEHASDKQMSDGSDHKAPKA